MFFDPRRDLDVMVGGSASENFHGGDHTCPAEQCTEHHVGEEVHTAIDPRQPDEDGKDRDDGDGECPDPPTAGMPEQHHDDGGVGDCCAGVA